MLKKHENEYFECDCHSKDHLLIVRKNFWGWLTPTEGKEPQIDIDISLDMIVWRGDYESWRPKDFILLKLWKRIKWRIIEAVKILITGKYKVEDTWAPCRTDEDTNDLIGITETKRLGETLIRFANDVEEFYKEKRDGK
jgi:hypothetical protein